MKTSETTQKQQKQRAIKWNPNMDLGRVVELMSGTYLNDLRLYLAYFGNVPSIHVERNSNCKKIHAWLLENHKDDIREIHFKESGHSNKKEADCYHLFCLMYEDVMLYLDFRDDKVSILFRDGSCENVKALIRNVRSMRIRKSPSKPRIALLYNNGMGIEIKSLEIRKPKLSIEDNYNNDFAEIHQTILKRLRKKNDKGMVLLHGKPGTGKTSYLRYLACSLRKSIIFLPPGMAEVITSPSLIATLIENPNSIFVIEDAENIIINREEGRSSGVSALLNLADGLLSDCLNIQIICSFNTDISKVDSALMRKGRLIAKYEFRELEIEKAQALSAKLGFKTQINTPMTLTDIYNQDSLDFKHQAIKTNIGFKSINAN